MRRNRRRLRQRQREFIAAVEQQRPDINPDGLLLDFENISKRSTARMVKLAMRSLALISAASYAAEELNNRLNAEDMNFRLDEVNTFARRLVRLHILRMMLRVFRLPKNICQQIVNLQIVKDFGNSAAPLPSRLLTPALSPPANSSRKNGEIIRPNPFLPGPRPTPQKSANQRSAQKPTHW